MAPAREIKQHEKCLLTELADGTGVLLHLETKFYFTLNATGVAVWKAVGAGARTELDVAQRLCEEFEVDPETARADLAGLLAMMLNEGLLR